jgi:hypothetical protein
MPKRTKKLLVYLDQNFISDIAKRDLNTKVKPEFTELYETLKTGFLEEKLAVPQSHFHDIETSLAPVLKKLIVKYQNHVGQISLYDQRHVEKFQIGRSLQRFLGEDKDPLDIKIAFRDHPDQRVKQYNITVDSNLERQDLRTGRLRQAGQLEALRREIIADGLSFADQLEQELLDSERYYLKSALMNYGHLATEQQMVDFGKSTAFRQTPIVKISAQLYAGLLTARTRPIKEGDATDVNILSTYLPYMDVVCTDTFMATRLKTLGIDKDHSVNVYSGKTGSLRALIDYLKEYVATTDRVNRPAISAFVLPAPSIKAEAFELFYKLGMAAIRGFQGTEYVEVFGFDDGHMPQYELRQMPGRPVPFYGLQDVDVIKLPSGSTLDDVLKICREHCSSTHFVLIDNYQEIPEHFFHGLLMRIDAQLDTASGYKIYKTKP